MPHNTGDGGLGHRVPGKGDFFFTGERGGRRKVRKRSRGLTSFYPGMRLCVCVCVARGGEVVTSGTFQQNVLSL